MRTCGRGHEWNPEINRQCPTCQKVYRKQRYAEFKEHDYQKSREWIANNKKLFDQKTKEWVESKPSHACYRAMLNRCLSPLNDHYAQYGGRGITVCDRWKGENGYANFIEDMGERTDLKLTIERENVNGNYEPSNCVWATRKQQGRNRRTNREVTIGGRTQCVAAWAEEMGVTFASFWQRLKNEWSEEELLRPNCQPWRVAKESSGTHSPSA
jgi:hypothetical protein